MGWCSGTEIFDHVAQFVLSSQATENEKYAVLDALAEALEFQDWDCQEDSFYCDDPIVRRIFDDRHPE